VVIVTIGVKTDAQSHLTSQSLDRLEGLVEATDLIRFGVLGSLLWLRAEGCLGDLKGVQGYALRRSSTQLALDEVYHPDCLLDTLLVT